MKTRLLDATEFKSTFAEPMRDVLATAISNPHGHFMTDGSEPFDTFP